MGAHWTVEEDRILTEHHLKLGSLKEIKEIQPLLPQRTLESIQKRASDLGLTKHINYWTVTEKKILIENYPKMSIKKMLLLLPRHSLNSIESKVCRMGILKHTLWTDEEDDILRIYYPDLGWSREMHDLLPQHTLVAIKKRIIELKIKYRFHRAWTDEENITLRTYYSELGGSDEMQKLLPRHTLMAICSEAGKLGLKTKVGGGPRDPEKRKLWLEHLSLAQIKQWKDPERRKQRSITSTRIWSDPELRKKESIRAIKQWSDPNFRQEQSIRTTRQWSDPKNREEQSIRTIERYKNHPELREKISIGGKRRFKDPEQIRQNSIRVTKQWSDPKARQEQSIKRIELFKDPEQRKKVSIKSTEQWSDPKNREEQSIRIKKWYHNLDSEEYDKACQRLHRKRPNNDERMIRTTLSDFHITYIPECCIHFPIRLIFVDVFVPPNICIFSDGTQYHKPKSEHLKDKDGAYWLKQRDIDQKDRDDEKQLRDLDYIVIRFSENNIKKEPSLVKQMLLECVRYQECENNDLVEQDVLIDQALQTTVQLVES